MNLCLDLMLTVLCLPNMKSHHKNNEIENSVIKYVYDKHYLVRIDKL